MINKTSKNYDVVILTHSPNEDLVSSLGMLCKQSKKPKNIIIYNTDKKVFYENIKDKKGFDKLLEKSFIKRIDIPRKKFDHGKARNDAMRYCKSDYVIYMTDDAIPYDKYMAKELLSGFTDKKIAAVYARQIAKEDAKKKERYVREFNYPKHDILKSKETEKKYGIKNCFCSNSCCMYDRSIFKKIGGFKEKLTQNEDMLYAYNVIERGYKVLYKSSAKVYHSHNFSYTEQFKRNYDIGVFQNHNSDIYDKLKSESEGIKLLKYVSSKFAKERHYIELIDFVIECGFRYFGYKIGKGKK